MSNYYVSGCAADGDDVSICDDSVAQFWTLYHRNVEGLSEGIIDCMFREDAEAAMRVYEQRDALAENEGYKQAFYEMAEILGIGARADSPKNVFEQVIKPMLINLQKERDQLAAENAALMSGVTYFACGSEYGFDLFKDKQSAIDTCIEEIELHREGYLDGDGWGDEVRKTAWGIVVQSAQGRDAQGRHTSDSQHTYQTCNYRLEDEVQTPATDAYLNSVRAEGVEMLATLHGDIADFADGDNQQSHRITQIRAKHFAAQLRAGEPS